MYTVGEGMRSAYTLYNVEYVPQSGTYLPAPLINGLKALQYDVPLIPFPSL